jgi:hypothetical protein
MSKKPNKLLLDCCKRCKDYDAKNYNPENCKECPVLVLYNKYKNYRDKAKKYEPYYNDAIWGPSNCIGDRHEMGSW